METFVLLLEDPIACYGQMLYAVRKVQHLGEHKCNINSRIPFLGVTEHESYRSVVEAHIMLH
jgi:hypothetical protein